MVVAVRPVQFSPPAPPSPIRVSGEIPQNGGGVIDGFVRRQNSEDPISDVQVTLTGGPATGSTGTIGQRRATTDGNGRFAFRGLPAGRYTIDLERDGYFRYSLKRGSDVDLAAGERSAGTVVLGGGRSSITVVLSMVRGGTISGRILDPSGRPSVAVSVSAARVFYQDGRPSMGPAKSAMSDDRGEYRLYWLEPGEYFVLAEKTLSNGSVRSYFPGGDGGSALKVKVTEGAESSKIDFSLGNAQTTVSISGTVTSRVAGFETVAPPPPRQIRQPRESCASFRMFKSLKPAWPSSFICCRLTKDVCTMASQRSQMHSPVIRTGRRASLNYAMYVAAPTNSTRSFRIAASHPQNISWRTLR